MGAARSSLFLKKWRKVGWGAVETTAGTSRSGYRRWSDGFISGNHPTDFPGQHVLFLSRSISSLWDAVYLLCGMQYIFFEKSGDSSFGIYHLWPTSVQGTGRSGISDRNGRNEANACLFSSVPGNALGRLAVANGLPLEASLVCCQAFRTIGFIIIGTQTD